MPTANSKSGNNSVQLVDHYVMAGDQRVPLLSGQVDYWLHPALHWKKILTAIKDCSLPMVSCYVPWNLHQLEDGSFDFVGATDPQRDLARFLDLAAELGLYVFVRPGPWIYTHYMDGGVPIEASNYHRLDPHFLAMSEQFIAEVCKVIRPRLATNGGKIVLCQLDNEIDPMPTLRGSSGGTHIPNDPIGETYFNQTINGSFADTTSYRSWLSRKYGSIQAFNQQVGMDFSAWDQVDVPFLISDKFPDTKRDLMAYLEWYTNQYAIEISKLFRKEGIDVPLVLNTFLEMEPHNNCDYGQIVELVGGDYWGTNPLPWREVLLYSRHARHLRAATQTPYSAEYQSITSGELIDIEGVYRPQNAVYWSLLAMLFGLKGWNWYVFVERSVLYFAPINNYGGIIPAYFERFKQMHDEFLGLDWPSYDSYPDGALWFYRSDFWDDVQYSQTPLIPFYVHSEYDAGSWMDWFERLHRMDYDIDIVDPDAQHNRIIPGTAVIVSGHRAMALSAQQYLMDLVNQGTHLIFLSTPPSVDLEGHQTDLFDFLPRPTRVEGRNANLLIRFQGCEYHLPSDYLALYDLDGLAPGTVESIDCKYGSCGYILQTNTGKIAILGFQPSNDLLGAIMQTLGIEPAAQSGAEQVLTSVWHKGSERVVVVVNTRDERVETKLSLNLRRMALQPEQRYRVTHRLAHQSQELTGRELAALSLSVEPKTGEIIHISPL